LRDIAHKSDAGGGRLGLGDSAVVALVRFASERAKRLVSVELNPLIVHAERVEVSPPSMHGWS
jgi:hypothetical protein